VRWIALDRRPVGLQGLIHTPQIEQGVSAVGGRASVAQRLGPGEDLDCFGKALFGVQQNAARAQSSNRAQVVADEEHRSALMRHLAYLPQALLLKCCVTHGQDFIHLAEVLPPSSIRAAIDSALTGKMTSAVFEEPPDAASETAHFLEAAVRPYRVEKGTVDGAVIELTDVDSLVNDPDVTVTTYRGTDTLLTDATGNGFLPGGIRVERQHDARGEALEQA